LEDKAAHSIETSKRRECGRQTDEKGNYSGDVEIFKDRKFQGMDRELRVDLMV
jgi:hypothetical protein